MSADVLRNQPQSHDLQVTPEVTFEPEKPRPPSQTSFESVDSVVYYDEDLREELKEVWPLKCVYPVLEILHTEESYVLSLEQMLKGYRDPLSNWLHSSLDGETFIRNVFSNLGQLFNTHRRLLQSLKNTVRDPWEFGQVFVKAEEEFAGYTEYCTNFNSATEFLQQTTEANSDLKEFLEICQHQLQHNLSLDAYLIKPVQRILKYHLLLQQVLKHFNTEHHAHPSLRTALHIMKKTATHINDMKRQMENSVRVKEIQRSLCGGPSRKLSYGDLIHECKCKIHTGKKGAERERELILFDKLLLLLKRKDAKRYNYKGHIEINELRLDAVESEVTGFRVYSQCRTALSYHVVVRSEKTKQDWVRKIDEVIKMNTESMKKKRQELSERMKRRRHSTEPKMMLASDGTKRVLGYTERGKRKRKTLSDIFSTADGEDDRRKTSRIAQEASNMGGREEGEGEGEGGEGEGLMTEGRVVPDISLAPISEEGSVFSQSDDILQPNQYLDTKSKLSTSVSMDSLVSLTDVELEDEGEGLSSHTPQLGGRYVEECNYGGEGEGEEVGVVGDRRGEQRSMTRQSSSNLRRKPAIRVKTRSSTAPPTVSPQKRGSRFTQKRTMIREKAQLARAETLPSSENHLTPPSDLIGGDSETKSCDSSLSSVTGLTHGHSNSGDAGSSSEQDTSSASVSVSTGLATTVTSHDEMKQDESSVQDVVCSEEVPLSPVSGEETDEIEIVDSSDSEEEEEEEISSGSLEEELGSSVEQPKDHQQLSNSGSQDDQTTEPQQQLSLSAASDSNTTGTGMEDSGLGSADWNSMERSLEPEIPVGSGNEDESSIGLRGKTIELYATMPRHKVRKYTGKPQLPVAPQTLIIPRDFSPAPRSHKSSSSSTSSSTSRTAGFSRLIEFTRKLSTPAYHAAGDILSQSVPVGGFSREILEEPSELVITEPPADDEGMGESILTPPPPKKQALDSPLATSDSTETAADDKTRQDGCSETVETALNTNTGTVALENFTEESNVNEIAEKVDVESVETENRGEQGKEEGEEEEEEGGREEGREERERDEEEEEEEGGREEGREERERDEEEEEEEEEGEEREGVGEEEVGEGGGTDIALEPVIGERDSSVEDMEEVPETIGVALMTAGPVTTGGGGALIEAGVLSTAGTLSPSEVLSIAGANSNLPTSIDVIEGAQILDGEKLSKKTESHLENKPHVTHGSVQSLDGREEEKNDREDDSLVIAEQQLSNLPSSNSAMIYTEPPVEKMQENRSTEISNTKQKKVEESEKCSSEMLNTEPPVEKAAENSSLEMPNAESYVAKATVNSSLNTTPPVENEIEPYADKEQEKDIEDERLIDTEISNTEPLVEKEEDERTEYQLTHRPTQVTENPQQQPLSPLTNSPVAQANTPVGFFASLLRRFRGWRIGNRRMLVFGFGFLTLASLLFLGVNFLYDDTQAKRPAVIHH